MTIKLILSDPKKTLLKISQTTQKGLLSAGGNHTLASMVSAPAFTHYNKPLPSSVKQGKGKNSAY